MLAKKKRGRPATGMGLTIGVRCHPPLLALLDSWSEKQPGKRLPRAAAIRRILQDYLGSRG